MADTAKTEAMVTGERLSMEEIWRRYPSEWVVVVDDDWDGGHVTSGVVYAHAPTRKEASAMSRGLRRCGIFWTGKVWTGDDEVEVPVLLWKLQYHVPRKV